MAGKASDAVGNTTSKAGDAVGQAAKKAGVPLALGGAAAAGAAGGMMFGVRQARRSNRRHTRRAAKRVARNVGTLGAQMGRLASEIHQAREAGEGRHRSPVEVVLEGLTARRSRP